MEYLEGVDLDADDFYARFEGGASPVVATSQPSPGRFADAYQRLADGGATEILSVHIGSALSGTVNSARLAAEEAPVPVRVVDTGTASFAVALCVWAAAEAVANGATLDQAAYAAERVSATVGNVFVVRALDLARAGGRLAPTMELGSDEIPVLTLTGGVMRTLGYVRDLDGAAGAMAVHVRRSGSGLRVGVGRGRRGTEPWPRPSRTGSAAPPRFRRSSATGSAPASAPTPVPARWAPCSPKSDPGRSALARSNPGRSAVPSAVSAMRSANGQADLRVEHVPHGCTEDERGAFDWAPPDDDVFVFITDLSPPRASTSTGGSCTTLLAVRETDSALPRVGPHERVANVWQAAYKVVYSMTLAAVSTTNTRLQRHFDPGPYTS